MASSRFLYFNFIILLILDSCTTKVNNQPEGFLLHPDFNMNLVASEPVVFDPVEMKFDDQGDAYILEMPGYPMGDANSRLIKLLDENDDGVYDKRVVFDDDLGVATSFLPYLNGFLVAAPPNLLWLTDANKDDKADDRKIILSGFNNDNLQHNFNGLTYGLNNWIYAANGGNNGSPYFVNKPENAIDLRYGDLRIHLEKEQLVRVGRSSGGYKLAFDEWGNLFGTHNTQHISHLVFEDRYIENLPGIPSNALLNISDHEENGSSRIYPIGEQETRVNHPEQSGYISGASGITYYDGGMFPKEFEHAVFVADCVLNLIHVDILSKERNSFKASRNREKVDFLAAKDRAFRPVNMTVGPDGALYVIDMHRTVIEHPEWIPDELEVNMDLDAGKEKGRIYKITPKRSTDLRTKALSINDPLTLVKSLNGRTKWERINAQRLLVTNNLSSVAPELIEQFKKSQNPLGRLHSMWTLEGLGELTDALLMQGLKDEFEHIREQAIKIAESRLSGKAELIKEILVLTKDGEARVSLQAALTLSTLNDEDYENFKAELLQAFSAKLSNIDHDIWSIRAIANVFQRNAFEFIQRQLAPPNMLTNSHLQVLEILTELVGQKMNYKQTASVVRAVAQRNLDQDATTKLVDALSDGWQNGGIGESNKRGILELQSALENIERKAETSLIRATGKLRQAGGMNASLKLKALLKEARSSVLDSDISTEQRLADLKLIALDDFDNREQLLYQLLDGKMPVALSKEALSQLQASNKSTIAPMLLERWNSFGPETRRGATNILLYKSYNHDLLLKAMENNDVSLGEFNLDLERRRVLLFSKDEQIKKRAEVLFSDAGVVKRKDAIEGMQPALTLEGNAGTGKNVFERLCASCHLYEDLGVEVGPSLTEIHRKSKESLMHDILDPNAAVNTVYLNHTLVTKGGNIYSGMIYYETDEEIGLRMTGGSTIDVKRKDIESLTSLGTSVMLEGLEASMSHQEMADLLAFLQSAE